MSMQLLRRGCSAPLSVNPDSLVTQPSSLFCRVDFEGGNANVAQQRYGPKNSCLLYLQKAHFRRLTWSVEFLCRFGVFSRIDSFARRYRQKLDSSKAQLFSTNSCLDNTPTLSPHRYRNQIVVPEGLVLDSSHQSESRWVLRNFTKAPKALGLHQSSRSLL
jgi:hypothetical protein